MTDQSYYYRGTTRGWPGGESCQGQAITCTTTDPLVATLFAIECRNHGAAVVLLASRETFSNQIGPSNWFALEECAVNLLVAPEEFAQKADLVLDVDRAVEVLEKLGIGPLPLRFRDTTALDEAIEETHAGNLRLSPLQVALFDRHAREPHR